MSSGIYNKRARELTVIMLALKGGLDSVWSLQTDLASFARLKNDEKRGIITNHNFFLKDNLLSQRNLRKHHFFQLDTNCLGTLLILIHGCMGQTSMSLQGNM